MRLGIDRERCLTKRRAREGRRDKQHHEPGDRHGAAECRGDLEREDTGERPEHEFGCDEDSRERERTTRDASYPEAAAMGDETAPNDREIRVERTCRRARV